MLRVARCAGHPSKTQKSSLNWAGGGRIRSFPFEIQVSSSVQYSSLVWFTRLVFCKKCCGEPIRCMSQVNRKEARFLTVLWHLNLGVACPCAIFTAAKTGRLQCKAPTGSPACHLRRPREGRGGLSDTVIKPGSCVGDTEKHFGGARGKYGAACWPSACSFSLPTKRPRTSSSWFWLVTRVRALWQTLET